MGEGKLHNLAFDLFVNRYGVNPSLAEYSKFDDVLIQIDMLGKCLFKIGLPFPDFADAIKQYIGSTIYALIDLANQQNIDLESTLVKVLEKYREK